MRTPISVTAALLAALTMACGGAPDEPAEEVDAGLVGEAAGAGRILRVDQRLDRLVPVGATIEKIAEGYVFTEGPVWVRGESRLLFSDVRANAIHQWTEADGASPFIDPVFEGDREGLRSISSNGLTLDSDGRLVIAEHGNRRISRVEEDGSRTVLADSYEGSRLNSPNDLVYASDGSLYFTDPSYGLEGLEESPLRELDFNGVYRLSPDGELELLVRDQSRPNGIALSHDERVLYVANSDADQKVWMAYDLTDEGAANARVFYDVNDQDAPGAADGMKVDLEGNVFATGPGGVWVFGWDGVHLGTIIPDENPANVAWGGDGRTLYMTANTGVYRVTLGTGGRIPGSNPTVVMETTHGAVTMELYQDQAPISVANFVQYVYAGFYEDTIFHRVIEDFMIQGGGFTDDLVQKFTREAIRNEATNGLSNRRGTVAMARTAGIDSATAQFFINTRDNARRGLDNRGTSPQEYGYAVFGEVVEGMDIVDAIARVQTRRQGAHEAVPTTPVIIQSMTVQ
ncbi:MAG: SMP-30/gluconolactonase/LRE family protein [Acidobacteria bacterium]|nr:SMP-30/gluconolactonase/LRE family protein [Acidobacteriota bacterium]